MKSQGKETSSQPPIPQTEGVRQVSIIGTAPPPVPPESAPAEWRDPRFTELDAMIKAEDAASVRKSPRTAPRKRRPRKRKPEAGKAERKALARGKELARRSAETIRRELGQQLNRAESIQVAQEFRSAVVPKRTPGRKPSIHVTRAYAAYQAGKRGTTLYCDHIPGYEKLGRLARKEKAAKLMAAICTRRRRDRERCKADG